jgi:hypothetical protein
METQCCRIALQVSAGKTDSCPTSTTTTTTTTTLEPAATTTTTAAPTTTTAAPATTSTDTPILKQHRVLNMTSFTVKSIFYLNGLAIPFFKLLVVLKRTVFESEYSMGALKNKHEFNYLK